MAASRPEDPLPQTVNGERPKRGRPSNAERATQPDRRQRILDVATARFAEFGFQATTVRQIADDVALGSGSLFHHFATKEEMLVEIVRPTVLRLRDEAARIAALPLDPERRLVALIRFNLEEVTANQAIHAILDHERKLFRRGGEFADVIEARKAAFGAWTRIIDDGVGQGMLRAGMDLFLTVSTIVRMLSAAADWHRDSGAAPPGSGKSYDVAALAAFYDGFILRSLRAPERTGEPIPVA